MTDIIFKYWPLVLFATFIAYQIYSYRSFKLLLNEVGSEFCRENQYEFIGIKHSKSHFSVIYKTPNSGKRKYKKFRMNAFLGKVKYLEWIK